VTSTAIIVASAPRKNNADGRVVGSRPIRENRAQRRHKARLVRSGRKVSFCMADIHIDSWARKGDGPRTYNAPDCLFPAYTADGYDQFIQGITNGWADVYDWYFPDQYMEVSAVPNGTYLLQTVADPDDGLVEANEPNNCGGVYIQLAKMDRPHQKPRSSVPLAAAHDKKIGARGILCVNDRVKSPFRHEGHEAQRRAAIVTASSAASIAVALCRGWQ
jgi:hypothetical protein